MTIQNQAQLNRLALVKQLYSHAAEHARSAATIDKIIAITSLDHAMEMLLEGVIQAYPAPREFGGGSHLYFADPTRLRSQTFQVERAGFFRLWDQVVAVLQELPDAPMLVLKSEMRSLHLARNEAQHSIKVPSSEFLTEMISACRTFLDHLLSVAFHITLRQISESLLVQTPAVREALERAQAARSDADVLGFAGLIRLAFVLAQAHAIQHVHVGRYLGALPPVDLLTPALDDLPEESGVAEGLRQLQEYLTHLHSEVASLSLELGLGLERQSFSRFSLLTPAVPVILPTGQVRWLESPQDLHWLAHALDEDTCHWLQDYAIGTILRWEAEGFINPDASACALAQAEEQLHLLITQKLALEQPAPLVPGDAALQL